MKKFYYVFFLVFFGFNSFGGTIRPDVLDDEYLKYGEKHKCVVQLMGKTEKGLTAYASAVVIDPHWVLTCAHVTNLIKNDMLIVIEDKKYKITKSISHEDFDDSKDLGVADLSLCYVEEEIKLDFYPSLYEENNELNKICSISGYGLTGTATTGPNKYDGKKRAGSNKISEINEDFLICDMSEKNFTQLEFLIAIGDSGGGLFINKKLAGINSSVAKPKDKKSNSEYGNESLHTRVSKYKSWILKNVKK